MLSTRWPLLLVSLAAFIGCATHQLHRIVLVAASNIQPPDVEQLAANAHYLFPDSSGDQLTAIDANRTQKILNDALHRIGPDMRPASGFEDYKDIGLDVATLAWRMMHKHAELVAEQRVSFTWPIIEHTLKAANVSSKCLEASARTARGARELKTWAIQLLNSWGSFPAPGIFEGTLGDVGSFHGCLDVPQNEPIGHAHYCTISYRPVLAPRRDYELVIEREPHELLSLFPPDDAFTKLIRNTQYNHFVYYKFGTCFPIDCSPVDVQKFARSLGRRAILLSGPVKCHSRYENDYEHDYYEAPGNSSGSSSRLAKLSMSFKDLNRGIYIWKPHMTTSQLVALICICALLGAILLFTLADLALNRLPALLRACDRQENVVNGQPTQLELNSDPNNNQLDCDAKLPEPKQAPRENGRPTDDVIQNEQVLLQPVTNGFDGHQLKQTNGKQVGVKCEPPKAFIRELIHDCSLITSTSDFLEITQQQLNSEILCLNGLRCITMSWIILAHTIQYNDWSAFARIYDVETQLLSWLNQPIFNASYLVDTFFLMSGLLTSYTVFKRKRQHQNRSPESTFRELWSSFSCKSYLIGRYLRLTPQILLVSLLFILLPLASSTSGPHWMAMTGEYSENCSNNWWINLFHIQAFYKADEMCNFVCWWISVDMFYHLVALAIVVLVLRLARPRLLAQICGPLLLANSLVQAARHFQMGLPPNMLSTIPQVGAMWSEMTLKYFWTPAAHLFPFIFGFYLGFLMAQRNGQIAAWFTRTRALAGWLAALCGFALVLFGTRWWVVGQLTYSAPTSTLFNLSSQLVWSLSLAWTIFACHFNHANFIGRLLACRLFIVLGRASYLVYLSHFLILFTFFGSQNLLLEPTRIMIIYIILGNICLSMLFGCILCVVFELPWLKIQKRIMRRI